MFNKVIAKLKNFLKRKTELPPLPKQFEMAVPTPSERKKHVVRYVATKHKHPLHASHQGTFSPVRPLTPPHDVTNRRKTRRPSKRRGKGH